MHVTPLGPAFVPARAQSAFVGTTSENPSSLPFAVTFSGRHIESDLPKPSYSLAWQQMLTSLPGLKRTEDYLTLAKIDVSTCGANASGSFSKTSLKGGLQITSIC